MRRTNTHTEKAAAPQQECVKELYALSDTLRSSLFLKLCDERLWRKHRHIMELCDSVNDNWPQTSYSLLMRFMGGSHNRTPFEQLSLRVPYNIVMRERSSLQNIEALLIGTSGLLDICAHDTYTNQLRQEFTHLRAKYEITPMSADEWTTSHIYPHSHPLLRLAQIAASLHKTGLSINLITSCTNFNDVNMLFAASPSEYWKEMILGQSASHGKIGSMQCNILGINFVAPLSYAYGNVTQNLESQQRVVSLLRSLPAEDNRYIRHWHIHGKIAMSALDTQAMLQLSKEYCEHGRCEVCPLKRLLHELKESKRQRDMRKNENDK